MLHVSTVTAPNNSLDRSPDGWGERVAKGKRKKAKGKRFRAARPTLTLGRTVMAIYRVDLLIDDPKPVFDWIDEHVPTNLVVRRMAYRTAKGWYVKAVFKRQTDAELFHLRWFPEASDHTVAPFTSLPLSQ